MALDEQQKLLNSGLYEGIQLPSLWISTSLAPIKYLRIIKQCNNMATLQAAVGS